METMGLRNGPSSPVEKVKALIKTKDECEAAVIGWMISTRTWKFTDRRPLRLQIDPAPDYGKAQQRPDWPTSPT